MEKPKKISNEELERIFDEGKEDILQYCDLTKAIKKPGVKNTNQVDPKKYPQTASILLKNKDESSD